MGRAYFQLVSNAAPDAHDKIVFDPFHVVAHANHAVDLVRRAESRELAKVGDRKLVGSKHRFIGTHTQYDKINAATI